MKEDKALKAIDELRKFEHLKPTGVNQLKILETLKSILSNTEELRKIVKSNEIDLSEVENVLGNSFKGVVDSMVSEIKKIENKVEVSPKVIVKDVNFGRVLVEINEVKNIIDRLNQKINSEKDGEVLNTLESVDYEVSETNRILEELLKVSKKDTEVKDIEISKDSLKKLEKILKNTGAKGTAFFGGGGIKKALINKSGEQINPATEDKQDDIISKLDFTAGFAIPEYDEIDLTYVSSGNGAGEVETVTYKKAGTTVGTLTFSYNASNEISNIIKS